MVAYATESELEDFLGEEPMPAGSARLLTRASQRVDEVLVGAVYAVDSAGLPTDEVVAAVLAEATLEQAHYMMGVGDDTGALAGFRSVSVGAVSYTRGSSTDGDQVTPRFADSMLGILQVGGLIPVHAASTRLGGW